MGTSASAYLWWGFVFHQADSEEYEGIEDAAVEQLTEHGEDRYVESMGLKKPEDDKDYRSAAWNAWRAEKEKIVEAGCEIISAGYQYDTTVVAVTASKTWAMDYGTEPVERMVAGDDWQQRLDTFCRAVGIESKPGRWFLSAEWG